MDASLRKIESSDTRVPTGLARVARGQRRDLIRQIVGKSICPVWGMSTCIVGHHIPSEVLACAAAVPQGEPLFDRSLALLLNLA